MPDAAGFTEQVSALAGAGWPVDSRTLTRALYSSDASLYRVPPAAVSRPASVPELVEVVDAARAAGLPVTTRGAGTSIAGNAVGTGLILDSTRLSRIAHLDPITKAAIEVVSAGRGVGAGGRTSTRAAAAVAHLSCPCS